MINGKTKVLTFSYDDGDGWYRFEEVCKMMSGRKDVVYGTCREALLGKNDF